MNKDYTMSDFELFYSLKQPDRNVIAYSILRGSAEYPQIRGIMLFSSVKGGTWIEVEVKGLPEYSPAKNGVPQIAPFGFHIHNSGSCSPTSGSMPFADAGGHYNPTNQPHGNHAGDLPVLFSISGYARMSFYTNKLTPEQVIGKSVVIHLSPDDYRTQPSGNSGKRIACGTIEKIR